MENVVCPRFLPFAGQRVDADGAIGWLSEGA